MPRNLFLVQRYIQPIKVICMSARSGKRKVKYPKISHSSLQGTKKRKLLDTSLILSTSHTAAMEIAASTNGHSKTFSGGEVVYLANPVKSQNDKKEYRYHITYHFTICNLKVNFEMY